MGIRKIYFADGLFCNESSRGIGSAALGKDIVTSLLCDSRYTHFGVPANYAVEMLRTVGRTGGFEDSTDWRSGDHDFDENHPTPGSQWAECRRLRRDARRVQHLADDLRDSGVAWFVSGRLLEVAEELRDAARVYDKTSPNVKPLRDAITLPLVKLGDRCIGAEAIWYDLKTNVFNFGDCQLGINKLGRLIAATLMRGEEKVRIGAFLVTVAYLVQMCRLVGRYGRFVDYNDDLFDGNSPPAFGYRDIYDAEMEEHRSELDDVEWV